MDAIDLPLPPHEEEPERGLVDDELRVALQAALAELSTACQDLLRLLTIDPPLSYADIGEALGLPHGSIGPTRQRCLERLRAAPQLVPFLAEARS